MAINPLLQLRIKKKSLFESWTVDVANKQKESSVCKDRMAMSDLRESGELDAIVEDNALNDFIFIKTVEVATPPTKTQYVAGETFDRTGMKVNVLISDGGEFEDVEEYTVAPEVIAADTTEVTITFTFDDEVVSTTYPITVTA